MIAWKCEIPKHEPGHFLGGPLFIGLDQDQNVAVTNSPVINYINKKPISATIVKNTNQVLRLKWRVGEFKDSKKQHVPNMDYSLILQKKSGKLNYYARSTRYDGSLGAQGNCDRIKAKG